MGRTGWKRKGQILTKEFRFTSFRDSIVFVNRVASLADDLNHHPDIDVRYTTVILALTTHEAQALTEKDLELAERVDFAHVRTITRPTGQQLQPECPEAEVHGQFVNFCLHPGPPPPAPERGLP